MINKRLSLGLAHKMPSDADLRRAAEAMADCCVRIAVDEQRFHADQRERLAAQGIEDADALIDVLDTFMADLDKCVEEALPTIDMLGDAPQLNVDALIAEAESISPRTVAAPSVDLDRAALAKAIAKAQFLDAWFEPIFNPFMDETAAHTALHDAFSLDGCLRFVDGSLLLPRRLGPWRNDFDKSGEEGDTGWDPDGKAEAIEPIGIFARYLRHLTFLPGTLRCDDPDLLTRIGEPISADYLLWNSPALTARPLPINPTIAVAPLAEYGSDVRFVPSVCKTTYGMALNYDENRFAAALSHTFDARAHILLIPEMALPEGDPLTFDTRIGDIIFNARADYWDRTKQEPSVGLVIAGVLGAVRADGLHRNYAVVFDGKGERSGGFEQRKLSHWNLSAREQRIFGIDHHHQAEAPLSDPIAENSLPADRLTVLEIPGVGRTATLICADMSQNNPGDWLAVNAILDWLYAPIMDKSICWEASDARRERRPWIVRRTYRAARLARTLVIATNSLSLTRWVNQANDRHANGRHLNPAGIGLAIDGRRSPPTHARVQADVDDREIVKIFETPSSNWKAFPPQP